MLDGHVAAVPHPDAGVDGAEAALAENLAHLEGALERRPRRLFLAEDGEVDRGVDLGEQT